MSIEYDLLKRALEVLQDERVPQLAIVAAIINDIQRFLDQQAAKNDEGSPCCDGPIISYRSFSKKVCADCGQEFNWQLKEGQMPLIKHTR